MVKPFSKDELEQIEVMERTYSPENIRASNEALTYLAKKRRLDEIDSWRQEQIRILEEKLAVESQNAQKD